MACEPAPSPPPNSRASEAEASSTPPASSRVSAIWRMAAGSPFCTWLTWGAVTAVTVPVTCGAKVAVQGWPGWSTWPPGMASGIWRVPWGVSRTTLTGPGRFWYIQREAATRVWGRV